ncbi:putative bifunctional diguanylate cyclase/phosphodiesterase [Undibacterium squillarum]|uniref:putative bifunctional diguanylate cyclase/phosphodiesterase n=1 Tax=Undibacterium squillarum TaxID=1131567 RepID=UPI0035AFB25F
MDTEQSHASCLHHCAEFAVRLQQEIDNARPDRTLALLVLHLQRSDRIISLISPSYADVIRQRLWERLRPGLRDQDVAVFASDNECWLMLPGLAAPELVLLAIHRILTTLDVPLMLDSHSVHFSPAIGVAVTPVTGLTSTTMIRMADQAQKRASAEHLRYAFAEQDIKTSLLPENLPKLVAEVIEANALNVVYQPKVDIHTHRVVAVEALVRWPSDHPQFVPVNELIDTVERCGMVEALTLQVLTTVLRESSGWQAQGLDVKIWINLSARLLNQPELPRTLAHKLEVWFAASGSIGLEITESALIRDLEQTVEVLTELKRLGFALAIDDFGTGYSSLAYLRRFPIDELKIDRVFVDSMTDSVQDEQIVKSIVDLAHNFGLPVVAEGAERAETVDMLRKMGCDQVQGYYFAKPMPASQLLKWCADFHLKHAR